ncbi:glycoside hydrolase family 1 protein [Sphingomonas canadensis]|uniref:Glycoside hydrolase family 1 protein n=1 Tax=Sphingomonas canadensis TaxID=1219257 RepID=A0ABW3H1J0_9SPHN|nr:family 1 glycosylhydrolase [Sphingomonas canadensis]MCW3834794.1 family 1 glycosylhydrolase [Sphingomonas canadensis]
MSTGFLWGTATAGHQVEGNNINADIWLLEQVPGTSFRDRSGDACDSLNRWAQDIAIVRSLGLSAYRFSVEWSRIEPAESQFSQAWLDHYARMAAACRDAGIAPIVTLSHFTSPRWFAASGGWSNPNAPQLFARFAERVARAFGGLVRHVITFNEPNLPLMGKWSATPIADPARTGLDAMLAAAARACGSDHYHVWVYSRGEHLETLLAGHHAARSAWKQVWPQSLVGMSLALPDVQGAGTQVGVEAYRQHAEAPFFAAARDDDFIGVQTYGRLVLDAHAIVPPSADAERTQSGDEFYPQALGAAVAHAHRQTGKPVFVTENGIATAEDAQRLRYLRAAIASLGTVRRQGVPVLGYLHWSLLDNFEWRRGYSQQFGLVSVDRSSFIRTPKSSARLYARLAREMV